MSELLVFSILSTITLGTALAVIFSKNPVHSILYLVACFFTIAGHYIMLNAQFLAFVQIIVYAGAVMVLFLFVVMMLKLK
jgi:NADH-quinone oxidoreductase subunit J